MPDDRHLLADILECAAQVHAFLTGVDVDDYLEDVQCQWAVNHGLILIGEAANNLTEATRSRIAQPWRDIVAYRRKAVHAYASITPARTYKIATEGLPALISAVEAHLREIQ